jgi:large subunit ribosomal protein L16
MLLQPARTKFRKYKKVKVRQVKNKTIFSSDYINRLSFGFIGLKSLDSARVTSRQLESARKVIRKGLNRFGCLWVIPFPDIPVTNKSLGVRMGKGKGNVSFWVCRLVEGDIIFEIDGVSLARASRVLKDASKKLPVRTTLVYRSDIAKYS